MHGSTVTRIDVFKELTFPKGTFDYEKCSKLLDEHYDDFVWFCDAVKLIPEEISEMTMTEVNNGTDSTIFDVEFRNGEQMQFVK